MKSLIGMVLLAGAAALAGGLMSSYRPEWGWWDVAAVALLVVGYTLVEPVIEWLWARLSAPKRVV
jgi:hypothetical protein